MIKKLRLNNEISVFYAPLFIKANFDENMLDEKDKAKLKDSPNLAHSSQFLASRALKFYVLKQFLSKDLTNKAQNLSFCLAHTKNLVALAAAPFKIGFDIELIKERNLQAYFDFCFNHYEKVRVLGERSENLDEFYRIFTTKEALIKFNNLQFSDFDKVGFDEKGKIMPVKEQKNQCLHHKISIHQQDFFLCCVF